MEKICCIIFDFDGVLVDSFDAAFKISKSLLHVEDPSKYKDLFLSGISKKIKSTLSASQVKSFFQKYGKKISHLPLVPGMDNILRDLKSDYLLAINSSANTPSIKQFLKIHNLDGYFKEILGYDIDPSKTEKILKIIGEYQFEKSDCLMITDTLGDIVEANEAGVATIGVTWGYHTEEELIRGKPFSIAHNPGQLQTAIKKYFSKKD